MRFAAVSALAMASTVSGHAVMRGIWVNGEDQGDGQNVYIRSPPNNNPVKDLSSPDLVCNVNGATAAPKFATAAAGDTVSFEWFHNTRNDDIIDGSHKGPIITWIAEYTETDGTGPLWTKIAEDGYDGTEWAVDKLIANSGKNDVTLPSSLAAGKYLVRQEIIALHESDASYAENPNRGAQFYPACVQLEVTGGGSATPSQNFDFNTDYTYSDPGIVFNLYNFDGTYEIPGPAPWTGSGSSDDESAPSASATQQPSATAIPEPTTSSPSAAAPTTTGAAGGNDGSAPQPTFSTIVSAPTTLVTKTSPAAGQPTATSTSTPAAPSACSSRKRSLKNKRSKKARRTERS